jgi:hypothetical protein
LGRIGRKKGVPRGHALHHKNAVLTLVDRKSGYTATTDIMIARDTREYATARKASLDGAGGARSVGKQTGKMVVSRENFLGVSEKKALPKKRDDDGASMRPRLEREEPAPKNWWRPALC